MKNDKYRSNESIFDNYDEFHNSFDKYLLNPTHSPLFPIVINNNYNGVTPSYVLDNNSFIFKNDSIQYGDSKIDLYMNENRTKYYYTYVDISRKKIFRIYSEEGTRIILDFIKNCSEYNDLFNSNVDIRGIIDIIETENGKTLYFTALLSSASNNVRNFYNVDISQLNTKQIINENPNLKTDSWRLITFSMIYAFLNHIKSDIPHQNYKDIYNIITDKRKNELLINLIKKQYDDLPTNLKDCCVFIENNYKYVKNSDRFNDYLDAQMCALANQVTHHLNYGLFEFNGFKKYHWDNKSFTKLVEDTTLLLCQNKNKKRWYFHTGTCRMYYLKALFFQNWCYIPDKVIKSATAIWLFYILYNNMRSSYFRDKTFYKTLLCFIIENNDLTIYQIIKIISNELIINHELTNIQIISSIIHHLTNGCQISRHKYTYNQYSLLSWNFKNIEKTLYLEKYKTIKPDNISEEEFINIGKYYLKQLYKYIKNMLESSDYTNKKIIDLVENMGNYSIPYYYKHFHR